MYTNKGSFRFITNKREGKMSLSLQIESDKPILDPKGVEDPVLKQLISDCLIVFGALLTNLLIFYQKNPILATFIAGGLKKEIGAKNQYCRDILKNLP